MTEAPAAQPARPGPSTQARLTRRLRWQAFRGWAILLALLGVIVLGTVGAHQYLASSGRPARLTDSLYMALQCLTLNDSAAGGTSGYPLAFQVARFVAPVVLVYATVYAFLLIFREQVDRWLAHRMTNHVVVCGFGEQGQALASSVVAGGERVAVIDLHPERSAVNDIRLLGSRVVTGDARDPARLLKAGVLGADRIVVMCGSDETNGEVVGAIAQAVEHKRRRALMVQVNIVDLALAEALLQHELRFGPRVGCMIVDYTCPAEQAARKTLDRYPPTGAHTAWPAVMVVGASQMAEAMLIGLAQVSLLSSFDEDPAEREPPRVILVDEHAPDMFERVSFRHPHLRAVLDVHVCPSRAVGTSACAEFVTEGTEVVYICLPDESQAMALGLSLQLSATPPAMTVVQTWRDLTLLDVTTGYLSGKSVVHHVGVLDVINDGEAVAGGFHEQLAMAIHEEYVAAELAKGPESTTVERSLAPWPELAPDLRETNRDQAARYVTALECIGARIVTSLSVDHRTRTLPPETVEALARIEHERWRRLKFSQGWTRGEPGTKQDPERKTHPLLCPYDELPGDEKEKDRAAMRNIPRLLATLNYTVELEPAGAPLAAVAEPLDGTA